MDTLITTGSVLFDKSLAFFAQFLELTLGDEQVRALELLTHRQEQFGQVRFAVAWAAKGQELREALVRAQWVNHPVTDAILLWDLHTPAHVDALALLLGAHECVEELGALLPVVDRLWFALLGLGPPVLDFLDAVSGVLREAREGQEMD